MNNYKRNFYFALFVGFMACGALAYYAYTRANRVTQRELQILALTDTLTRYKTKDGKNAAYTRVLEGTKKELLAITEKQDKHLNELLKTKGLRTVTTHSTITRTDTVVKVDTLRLPTDTQQLYIAKHITNEYYDADVVVTGDSLRLTHTSYNEFDYMLQDKPAKGIFGFLKPTTYIVEAVNNNPYTTTRALRTLQITPKSKTGLKISIGLVIGVGAVLLLR